MIAKEALNSYSIDFEKIKLIGLSANTVYEVIDNNNRSYSLRLNVSKNNALDDKWTNEFAINSEMQWLDALSKETDISVPIPYKNSKGEFVTNINGVFYTLLKWLEGE